MAEFAAGWSGAFSIIVVAPFAARHSAYVVRLLGPALLFLVIILVLLIIIRVLAGVLRRFDPLDTFRLVLVRTALVLLLILQLHPRIVQLLADHGWARFVVVLRHLLRLLSPLFQFQLLFLLNHILPLHLHLHLLLLLHLLFHPHPRKLLLLRILLRLPHFFFLFFPELLHFLLVLLRRRVVRGHFFGFFLLGGVVVEIVLDLLRLFIPVLIRNPDLNLLRIHATPVLRVPALRIGLLLPLLFLLLLQLELPLLLALFG